MMASNTSIPTEKETQNWVKAILALNVTKDGLTKWVETELNKVQKTIGEGCGNCFIENLLACPTPGMCKRSSWKNCDFHLSKRPKKCKICDRVKQNIISLHRFKRPSWKYTQAERWGTEPWEIGKCYLPDEGYSRISSVEELDLNGVMSILLNCKHFETCLSTSSLSSPMPNKPCLLEKVM
ncbi:hypothetical protein DPMN_031007 [Dreissena polymorpha]|uniref:Uncharacterized protein n=1 Tax=Dreissena polymorpha TaxID=45954 RepID=A0A9D4RIV7_DREPO|nr:hypothetical protein DPMN_031007 [Dreissena polymorpha]